MLNIMRSRRMPALLTRMLSLPKLSIAHSMIRLAALKSVTLSKLATASPPAERISLTTSSAGERDCPVPSKWPPRSLTTTLAPCLASNNASSRPMPRPAPVITATLPVSSAILLIQLCFLVGIWSLLGDFARSFYVEVFFGFYQGFVQIRGQLVDEVDGHLRFILVARVQHDAAGTSVVVEIARPGFAQRHDQRRGDVKVVLLQFVLVESNHPGHLRVHAEQNFAHRTFGFADVFDPGARIYRHGLVQVRRQRLAGLVGRGHRGLHGSRRDGSGYRRGFAIRQSEHAGGGQRSPTEQNGPLHRPN